MCQGAYICQEFFFDWEIFVEHGTAFTENCQSNTTMECKLPSSVPATGSCELAVNTTFDSFDQFEAALKKYSTEYNVQIVKGMSKFTVIY